MQPVSWEQAFSGFLQGSLRTWTFVISISRQAWARAGVMPHAITATARAPASTARPRKTREDMADGTGRGGLAGE
jgi:hypothetical protein